MTDRERLESATREWLKIKKGEDDQIDFSDYLEEYILFLLSLASRFVELKEGLRSGKLENEFYDNFSNQGGFSAEPGDFISWLLSRLESTPASQEKERK